MGSLAELAKTYLTACEVEGKSPRTIRGYRETLTRFAEINTSRMLPPNAEDFSVQDVYVYLAALRERNISRAYQHRIHREVKMFFSWCKRLDIVQDIVFARVPIVKLEQQIIQPFSPDEIRALLGAIDRRWRPGIRNYALVLFLRDTGVRASECVSVRLDDVDWERGRVRVLHGKAQKQRWTGLGEEARCPAGVHHNGPRNRGGITVPVAPVGSRDTLTGAEHAAQPSREGRRGHARPPASLPTHLRDVGDSLRGPRDRRPESVRAFVADDGPAARQDLSVGAGSSVPRAVQSRRPVGDRPSLRFPDTDEANEQARTQCVLQAAADSARAYREAPRRSGGMRVRPSLRRASHQRSTPESRSRTNHHPASRTA